MKVLLEMIVQLSLEGGSGSKYTFKLLAFGGGNTNISKYMYWGNTNISKICIVGGNTNISKYLYGGYKYFEMLISPDYFL